MGSYEFSVALDQDYMNQNYGSDLDFCKRIFELFVKVIPSEIDLMNKAALDKDFITIATLAHKVKPSFKMVGFTSLSDGLMELEVKAKSKNNQAFECYEQISPLLETNLSIITQELEHLNKFLDK